MKRSLFSIALLMAATATCAAEADPKGLGGKDFSEDFFEEKSDLGPTGRNPFFILEPGETLEYKNKDGSETLKITVLDETRKVDGVETRILEEREMEDGKVIEVSRNYFAISKRTNNVYYFGEDSTKYKDGKESKEGSWEAGKDGAKYGLMMEGSPMLGARYYQEISPGIAMDRAENVSTSETLTVPAGTFTNVLKTEESNPLEPGHIEHKHYARGVGLIKDSDVLLVKHTPGKAAR